MTNQPSHPAERPPTLRLGPGDQIFQNPLLAGLDDEEKRWCHLLWVWGKRDLPTLAGICKSLDPLSQEVFADWKNLWLIWHQDRLWIYGFSKEEKQLVFEHLRQLRTAGYYRKAFTDFEEYRERDEWGC